MDSNNTKQQSTNQKQNDASANNTAIDTSSGIPMLHTAQSTQAGEVKSSNNTAQSQNFNILSTPTTNQQAITPKNSTPKTNPNSTQNSLLINEIRDGIVIMNDGTFRSVVMAKSINFDLMSDQEREGVEVGYQAFLNSLYFPIQIFINSQKVDIGPYISKLDKIRTEHDNMLLAMLMEDYISFIVELANKANIMDKKFYVVIPYFPKVDTQKVVKSSKNFLTGVFGKKDQTVTINEADLSAATEELRNRVQAVLGGLQQCGIQGLPLDTQELIELYYDTYNPDTATHQHLVDFEGITTPVVTKGEGPAARLDLNEDNN